MTRKNRENHKWTEEEREIVRRDYRHTHASREEIGRRLGVGPNAVVGQVSSMGIAKRSDRHPWNPPLPGKEPDWEDALLHDLGHQYCPRLIAKMMRRSLNSVTVRMKRQGVFRRYRDGWYTKADVCGILGMDHKWVQRRIDSGALRARPHDPESIPPCASGSSCWHIDESALRKYIINHPDELNGRNVDLIVIVDLLVNGKNKNGKEKGNGRGLEKTLGAGVSEVQGQAVGDRDVVPG